METNDNWYILGKKDCEELIKEELVKRGAEIVPSKYNYGNPHNIFYVVCGVVHRVFRLDLMGYRITKNWKEIKIEDFSDSNESEDERIRKSLLNEFIHLQSKGYKFAGLEGKDIISWLEKQVSPQMVADAYLRGCNDTEKKWFEKQGEQKSTDKPEPKFKVGDWIVCEITGSVYQIRNCIENLSNHKYGYDLTNGGYIGSDEVNHYHLWTIQDAKDGDVLVASDDSIFIYAGSTDRHAKFYVASTKWGTFNLEGGNWEDKNRVHPATKEQRELLFKKMAKNGYEWDSEKKELKLFISNGGDFEPELSQEPTNWTDGEGIRKAIIGLVIENIGQGIMNHNNVDCNDMISWLEKQGEHKFTWKPTKDQIDAFTHFVRSVGESGYASPYDNNTKQLYSLLNDLKGLTHQEVTKKSEKDGKKWIDEKVYWKEREELFEDGKQEVINNPMKYGLIKDEDHIADASKKVDPKVWTDEDDYNLQCVIAKADKDIQNGNVGRNQELIDWLKSIKNRVQPQLKQKWTEEDENGFENVLSAIKLAKRNVIVPDDMRNIWHAEDWLRELKKRIGG